MERFIEEECDNLLDELRGHIDPQLIQFLEKYPSHHRSILERIKTSFEDHLLSLEAFSSSCCQRPFGIDPSLLDSDITIDQDPLTNDPISDFAAEQLFSDDTFTIFRSIPAELATAEYEEQKGATACGFELKFSNSVLKKWLERHFTKVPPIVSLRAKANTQFEACLQDISAEFQQPSLRNFISSIVLSIASPEAFFETSLTLREFRQSTTSEISQNGQCLVSQLYNLRGLEKQQRRSQLVRRVVVSELPKAYEIEAEEYKEQNRVTITKAKSAVLGRLVEEYSQRYNKGVEVRGLAKSFQNYLSAGKFWSAFREAFGLASIVLVPIKGDFKLETQKLEYCPQSMVQSIITYLKNYRGPFLSILHQQLSENLRLVLAKRGFFRFRFESETESRLLGLAMDSAELLDLTQPDA